ncbi:unnamed protein product [Amoebophrya sp. A25]|nr:unnamed protein product [Amoebophrya sp. A25]|eukprot:GSA25T00027322001.1
MSTDANRPAVPVDSGWQGHEQPQVELRRSYMKLPRGRIHAVPSGQVEYDEFGNVSTGIAFVRGPDSHLTGARTVPFLRTEETTRPGANQALGPSARQVGSKLYQNEWVFRAPEEPGSHFADDYEKAVDEKLGVIYIQKAKQKSRMKFADQRLEAARREILRKDALANETFDVNRPQWYDSYSGQPLVQRHGKMIIAEEHDTGYDVDPLAGVFDFDNFRIAWPFSKPERNKMITQGIYDWYDRGNPYIQKDEDVRIRELATSYIDATESEQGNVVLNTLDDVIDALRPI